MMLLGLVLHSAASYTSRPLGAAWPYHDAQASPWFDLLGFIIHLFRMPVFFMVAGFFGALLFYRDGPGGMARNRLKRVLAPLALAWVVLYPLTAAGFVFALGRGGTAGAPGWGYVTSGTFLTRPNLIHLWFLYDLLLLYAAALAPLAADHLDTGTARQRCAPGGGEVLHRTECDGLHDPLDVSRLRAFDRGRSAPQRAALPEGTAPLRGFASPATGCRMTGRSSGRAATGGARQTPPPRCPAIDVHRGNMRHPSEEARKPRPDPH